MTAQRDMERPATLEATAASGADAAAIRRLMTALMVIIALFAVSNLAFLPHESSGPPVESPPAPVMLEANGHMNIRGEVKRFVKHQIDLDREGNVATWCQSSMLAITGFLGLVLLHLRKRLGWLWIGLGFLYLSCDELAQIHEWVGGLLWHSPFRLGFLVPPYPWVVLFGPPLFLFAAWMTRFMGRELRGEGGLRRGVVLGLVFLALTVPLEALGGKFEATSEKLLRVESTVEESFEFIGETLLLFVFLTFTAREFERRGARRGRP